MRRIVVVLMVLALVAATFAVLPLNVAAPSVTEITPKKGKVGQNGIIHGQGLGGGDIKVKFGSAGVAAENVQGLNDKAIKVTVPLKSALDPNPVKVAVTVDGVPVEGDIWFLYDPPGTPPVVTGIDPPSVQEGEPFTLLVTGTDFTTPQGRVPYEIFLVSSAHLISGMIDVGSVTETSFRATFLPAEVGVYKPVVGFSDGTGDICDNVFEVTPR